MAIPNELRFFSVKVAQGSGCLIQPKNETYSYILTAKHVIDNFIKQNNFVDLTISRLTLDKNKDTKSELLELVSIYTHVDNKIDAAILKVKKVSGLIPLYIFNVVSGKVDNCYLIGYPGIRIEKDNFRINPIGHLLNEKEKGYYEARLEENININEVKGQSGGGIIKLEGDQYVLIGIQSRMSAPEEDLSRIDFMPINLFDEIIEQNSNELTPIGPAYDPIPQTKPNFYKEEYKPTQERSKEQMENQIWKSAKTWINTIPGTNEEKVVENEIREYNQGIEKLTKNI